jgi:glycosyltransferase involved in cell wall biosynthesis
MDRELIVLDDDDDPSFPNGLDLPTVRYSRSNIRECVGTKRNRCCELATGEYCAHFDSDDWSAPGRLQVQFDMLQAESDKAVSGFHSMLFYEIETRRIALYRGTAGYGLGTSLMYRHAWWRRHPFPARMQIGEDRQFATEARRAGRMITCPAADLMIARTHAGNTSKKNMSRSPYVWQPHAALPPGFPR